MNADIVTTVGFNPITGKYGGATLPTGTIAFYAGTTQIGSPVSVSGNIDSQTQTASGHAFASFQGSQLPLGQDAITAVYSGDSNYAG